MIMHFVSTSPSTTMTSPFRATTTTTTTTTTTAGAVGIIIHPPLPQQPVVATNRWYDDDHQQHHSRHDDSFIPEPDDRSSRSTITNTNNNNNNNNSTVDVVVDGQFDDATTDDDDDSSSSIDVEHRPSPFHTLLDAIALVKETTIASTVHQPKSPTACCNLDDGSTVANAVDARWANIRTPPSPCLVQVLIPPPQHPPSTWSDNYPTIVAQPPPPSLLSPNPMMLPPHTPPVPREVNSTTRPPPCSTSPTTTIISEFPLPQQQQQHLLLQQLYPTIIHHHNNILASCGWIPPPPSQPTMMTTPSTVVSRHCYPKMNIPIAPRPTKTIIPQPQQHHHHHHHPVTAVAPTPRSGATKFIPTVAHQFQYLPTAPRPLQKKCDIPIASPRCRTKYSITTGTRYIPIAPRPSPHDSPIDGPIAVTTTETQQYPTTVDVVPNTPRLMGIAQDTIPISQSVSSTTAFNKDVVDETDSSSNIDKKRTLPSRNRLPISQKKHRPESVLQQDEEKCCVNVVLSSYGTKLVDRILLDHTRSSICDSPFHTVLSHHPNDVIMPRPDHSTLLPVTPTVHRDDQCVHPVTYPIEIRPADVLLGRGGVSNQNMGNIYFRQLVSCYRTAYNELPKGGKGQLGRNLRTYIRLSGGRFLEQRNRIDTNNKSGSIWYECGDDRAHAKITQALRETNLVTCISTMTTTGGGGIDDETNVYTNTSTTRSNRIYSSDEELN